jgi:hypothetical protein
MTVKHWAMIGFVVVTGLTALWRNLAARRRSAASGELQIPDRIRHAGRLVAGRGVQRVS